MKYIIFGLSAYYFIQTDEDSRSIDALYRDETFWRPQKDIARLFGVNVPAISRHLKNIRRRKVASFRTVFKMETVQNEGGRKTV